jgi:hypothetical protein
VHIALGREAGAEVDELVNACGGQVTHGALEEEAVLPDDLAGVRNGFLDPLGGLPVDRVIVLATEVIVVDPASSRRPCLISGQQPRQGALRR